MSFSGPGDLRFMWRLSRTSPLDCREERAERHISNFATLFDLCGQPHKSSRGTKDCARRAIAAGIPTYLIDSEAARPKRLHADDSRLK
jgi:hypothetical protein